jgi:uncharacterized protein YkwD
MNRTKTILVILFALVLGLGIYVAQPTHRIAVQHLLSQAGNFTTTQTEVVKNIEEDVASVALPTSKPSELKLSRQAIIEATNKERELQGLKPLAENSKLNNAAELKLKDMFDRQYFEHQSPDGHGPSYLAEQTGYTYIVIGENLALGNFRNDAALVTAWMESPGHRANILHTRFMEIGVAVGQGMYNGKKTILAVQEFGQPSTSCPGINDQLKDATIRDEVLVDEMSDSLGNLRRDLDVLPYGSPEQNKKYNQKIDEFNTLVKRYNITVTKLKVEIESYNAQVRAFNACVRD